MSDSPAPAARGERETAANAPALRRRAGYFEPAAGRAGPAELCTHGESRCYDRRCQACLPVLADSLCCSSLPTSGCLGGKEGSPSGGGRGRGRGGDSLVLTPPSSLRALAKESAACCGQRICLKNCPGIMKSNRIINILQVAVGMVGFYNCSEIDSPETFGVEGRRICAWAESHAGTCRG